MRKFYLQNQDGVRVGLNGEETQTCEGVFLGDPSGLGSNFERTYANMNDGFFAMIRDAEQQATVNGTLVFTKEPYSNYKALVDWIMAASALYLIYAPQTTEYYRQVDISYITKTEINVSNVAMEVPVSFNCKTPWYRPAAVPVTFNTAAEGTKYSLVYDDDLYYFASASGTYSAELEKGGHLPAAVKINFTGSITNPVFTLKGVSTGKVYGECDITTSLSGTDRLELFTSYLDSHVIKTSNGTETNLIDNIDLTKGPFFHVPLNENVILSLTASGTIAGEITAWMYYYYRTV